MRRLRGRARGGNSVPSVLAGSVCHAARPHRFGRRAVRGVLASLPFRIAAPLSLKLPGAPILCRNRRGPTLALLPNVARSSPASSGRRALAMGASWSKTRSHVDNRSRIVGMSRMFRGDSSASRWWRTCTARAARRLRCTASAESAVDIESDSLARAGGQCRSVRPGRSRRRLSRAVRVREISQPWRQSR